MGPPMASTSHLRGGKQTRLLRDAQAIRHSFRIALLASASLLWPAVAAATTLTWNGGGGDNSWTSDANWVGGVAPVAGDNLVFDATGVGARPSPNNDFADGTSFGTITVSVGGYSIGGTSVSLTTGLTASNTSGSSTVSLTIGGAGTVTKTGAGTLILSGANTHIGTTTSSGGTLLVNGSQSSSVNLTTGTFGGIGTVGDLSATGGTVSVGSPANTPGQLNSGNLNLGAGAPNFSVQLNGTTVGTGYDQLNVTGTVNLTAAALNGTAGFGSTVGDTFTIINNDSTDAVTGVFAGKAEGSTIALSGQNFTISYVGGTGNDVVLTRTASTFTWNGGGGNNNWTTAGNWVGGMAPGPGDSLIFSATGVGTRPTPNNDFAAATSFKTITVSAGGYTIDGNSVSLTTGVTASNASGSSTVSLVVGGAGTVTKSGAGTLTLSGTNTFTGSLTISSGTVLLGASDRIADGVNVTLSGGTFAFGGFNETIGTLALSANSTIDLGSGASVIHFADSSAVSWTGGTRLTVSNWSGLPAGGGTDQLYVGSSSAGLTATHLAQIRFFNGSNYPPARILATGEVVPHRRVMIIGRPALYPGAGSPAEKARAIPSTVRVQVPLSLVGVLTSRRRSSGSVSPPGNTSSRP
jgi:autotransporter-associated beta strand protein